ncbi:MAG: bifunctional diaminohydroxyphosphoribosylaminopyrimidine deaminase/5-amino-6-(5-phosphoribosylamino)uracil reductase RibD [Oscillospiraceae bacterium]|nr:bifunctional diaminohydroxyphosphoribosylaminopyrimidine deaminase/5-amino-6-(5-phosphoribosylamino)uracil reductase RibD [Oscillospiraceae bacterium]
MEEKYMRRAIELAKKGIGFVNPNPLVGAVIVKDGRIIGEGYHERYGTLHAERNAIANLCESAEGADIYVTLEPCCHHGKQPPCTEAVLEAGIKNVYVGSYDPNPLVSGKGFEFLRENGINVTENVLRDECDALNDIFFHYITTKTPYVIMKAAMSIDGRTAAFTGDSKWISNKLSRADVHQTRKRCAAIMVGINTVLADNPMLDCRCENPSNPIRVICDSRLRIPMDSQIIKTTRDIPTIIATVSGDTEKTEAIKAAGAEIIVTDGDRVDLPMLMAELGKRKIDSVLVEGGAELHASMLETGFVNELHVYIAPKIIGGVDAKPVVGGRGVELVRDSYMFGTPKIERFGDDIKVIYRRVKDVHRNN